MGTSIYKEFIHQVASLLFGTTNLAFLLAGFILAIMGVALNILMETSKRDKSSPRTPEKFSYKFLLIDNAKRLLVTLIMIFISIRFFFEIYGINLNLFHCFVIGFCSDLLSGHFKRIKANFTKSKITIENSDTTTTTNTDTSSSITERFTEKTTVNNQEVDRETDNNNEIDNNPKI